MARGWESKAVESQIEAAESRGSRSRQAQLNAEQLRMERERESIELSRTRVLQDLAAASNPKYRDLLNRSLQYLDEKLKALNAASSKPDRPE
jgi:molecular chaperone GrpE (heat shock protein)